MTNRERFLGALMHQETDRVPWNLEFTPGLCDLFEKRTGTRDLRTYYDLGLDYVIFQRPPQVDRGPFERYYPHGIPKGAKLDEWGVASYAAPGNEYPYVYSPLKDCTDPAVIDEYPWPDLMAPWRHADLDARMKAVKDNGLLCNSYGGNFFQKSWDLMGQEKVLMDMMTNPDLVHALFSKLSKMYLPMIRRIVSAGTDMLRFIDDIAMQSGMLMRPELWRKFLKPYLARSIRTALEVNPRQIIYYHSDGDITLVLDDLLEMGVSVINPVQPECMDVRAVKRRYGKRLALWGCISAQKLMPYATPGQVRTAVRDTKREVGKDGGLVLDLMPPIGTDVPWQNIDAYVEACRESQ